MQSAHNGVLRAFGQWTTLGWWPPVGWWPDAARDLLTITPDATPASATFVLPPSAESVHSSRSFAMGTLTGWGLPELNENMELIVSELATNALRHGLSLGDPARAAERRPERDSRIEEIRLSLVRRGNLVTCAIADPGATGPVLRYPGPLEPGGLGLHIVESLSARWGWSPLPPYGKIVWAVLAAQTAQCRPSDPPGTPELTR
ncbi:ATP-binding protein [Spongiactinospora sp. TRM90649]|uniref:ATP-binding protein n=1 Tax=Spongiactinospora sp. TRM90649 TaxID=3031114 RepID=UPI0023F8A580|nr:ATP-binding protein [Spongiactinospora sp. TRM90649]MDF5755720.1 ATP-binding protein [Spongiactinospora sp. TRM90649]